MLSIFSKHQLLKSRFGKKSINFVIILVAIILFSIFIVAYNVLQRPVNTMQYQQVIYFHNKPAIPEHSIWR